MSEILFDYFDNQEAEQCSFNYVPKLLIQKECFRLRAFSRKKKRENLKEGR